jgi:hypothetical protein
MNWFYAIVLEVELLLIAAFLCWPALRSRPRDLRLGRFVGLLVVLCAGAGVLFAARQVESSSVADVPVAPATETTSVGDLVGNRLRWFDGTDVAQKLAKGNWMVIVCDSDAFETWQALVSRLGDLGSSWSPDLKTKIAVIRLLDSGSSESKTVDGVLLGSIRAADLSPRPKRLSVYLRVSDGLVKSALEGNPRFPDYRQARQQSFDDAVNCGPYALLKVLRQLGVTVGPPETRKLLDLGREGGTNLGQLKELAERRGLHAVGIETTSEDLKKIGLPAIVHLNGGTFAAVLAYAPEGFKVAFPSQPASIVRDADFIQMFGTTGHALLVSTAAIRIRHSRDKEQTAKSNPIAALSRSSIPLGRLWQRDWRAEVELTNRGNEPLQIEGIETSCSCTHASISSMLLAPMETATLSVSGRQAAAGDFSYRVTLRTNAPDAKTITVPLHGYIETPILIDPPAIAVRRIAANEKSHTLVSYELPEHVNPDSLSISVPAGAPLRAHAIRASHGRGLVEVDWMGSNQSGWHNYQLLFRTKDLPGAFFSTLQVAVEVLPTLEAFPQSIVLRPEEIGEHWSRNVTISTNVATPADLSTRWNDASFAELFTAAIRPTDAKGVFALVLSPKAPGRERRLMGSQARLIIESKDQSQCQVQVSLNHLEESLVHR